MKVQCSCGAKYEFEITPAMQTRPVQFVCPACGTDASDFVDSLIRRQLGQAAKPAGEPVQVTGSAAVIPQPPRLGIAVRTAGSQPSAVESGDVGHRCLKHPGQITTEKCHVCSKPICPKCMELFGYVCSPLCKAKADSHGIHVPVYAGQKSLREARSWRKIVWVSSTAAAVLALALGFWFWYAWFGSIPKSIFSVRFPDVAYAGQSAVCGESKSQLVFIHGNVLARYDLGRKQEIWSTRLLDPKQFADMAESQLKAMQQHNVQLADKGIEDLPRLPSSDKLIAQMEEGAESQFAMHVRGSNIWVALPGKLVRYDWVTGKTAQELAVRGSAAELIPEGDEFMTVDMDSERPRATYFNLASCETRTVPLNGSEPNSAGDNSRTAVLTGKQGESLAGMPGGQSGKDIGRPMDPSKVAQQAQHLSMPARTALPATVANAMHNEQILAALNDQPRSAQPAAGPSPDFIRSLIPTKHGFIELSARVLERRVIQRSAMKGAPSKSALDGNLTAGSSMDAANEMLNEMQRSRGGDIVQEDQSRYQVTLRVPGAETEWTSEVMGPPRLFPLDSVNVLAAGKMIVVFDSSGKKLWQSTLNFELPAAGGQPVSTFYGQGPCVERNGSLYVFDQGVLTAFDLATGNARWRLPSVGITGLFFDDHDMVYVNSTTASPDKIKYSRQIDLSQKANVVVLKVDSKNGKILWTAEQVGFVNYVSGKLVLSVQSFQPEEDDSTPDTGFETPPYLRIRRLNENNGHEMWEHFQQRCPLDIGFDKNLIRLVFKKEVQVLKFLML